MSGRAGRRVAGHALRDEGAAFHVNGRRARPGGGPAGWGYAMCECGEMSPRATSIVADRKRWHFQHKLDVLYPGAATQSVATTP